MAKFRNVDKRRLRPTGVKKSGQPRRKQVVPFGDGLEEYYSAHPTTQSSVSVVRGFSISLSLEEKVRVMAADMISGDGDVQPPAAPKRRMCALDAVIADDGDVQPLGATPRKRKEGVFTDSELLLRSLSRLFRRLRGWLRGFWSAARWTHPAAWLMASRHRARP